jgi:heat shock protein HtpX
MGNTVKTTLLLGLLSGLLLVIGDLLGGQSGLVLALVLATAMNFVSYWFSDKIVLRMYGAREVGAGHPLHSRCRAST